MTWVFILWLSEHLLFCATLLLVCARLRRYWAGRASRFLFWMFLGIGIKNTIEVGVTLWIIEGLGAGYRFDPVVQHYIDWSLGIRALTYAGQLIPTVAWALFMLGILNHVPIHELARGHTPPGKDSGDEE